MDCVAYEAPLDSSFQKDRLELVNKGSLGRRRKPTRANLKLLLLSPSLSARDPDPLPPSSSPAKKTVTNGDVSWKKTGAQTNQRPLRTDPGLPRTPPVPTTATASEAQQSGLKRKNSDLGRSAVLIQTWERRTHSESFSKKRQNPVLPRNRFLDKENVAAVSPAMPDSCICPRYTGSLQNGDSKRDGELVRSVRGAFHDGRSLHPSQQNILKCPTGRKNGVSEQEPEWVSLSRKLCAKFVEGHIEHHSTNSCDNQELNGVSQVASDSHVINGMKRKEASQKTEEKKKITVEAPSGGKNQSNEPPWIPLSRKLCTKFIEEHIEYPASVCDRLEKPDDVLEPNGDVRIIEKIGNPKSNKKKARRDSEPEWISLSRKLRAKFIESHIDDPDTIALDNQLNASDPEETSSESLSDSSQEINAPKVEFQSTNRPTSLGTTEEGRRKDFTYVSSTQCPPNQKNESFFVEKECCWEYQEMEFDQESNSGTFQDAEFYEIQNGQNQLEFIEPDDESRQKKDEKNFENPAGCFKNRICFADIEKSKSLQKIGNESNDVIFLPRSKEDGTILNTNQEKKIITVQFIAHPESTQRGKEDTSKKVELQNETQTPFFNLTTWEEAHYVSDQEQSLTNQNSCLDSSFKKDFRSKSLDDLCESKEEALSMENSENDSVEKVESNQFCTSGFKIKLLCKSEEYLNKDECSIPAAKSNDETEDDFTSNWTTAQENERNEEAENNIKSPSPQLESRNHLDSSKQTDLSSKLITEKKHLNVTRSETGQISNKNFLRDSKPKCNGVIPNSRRDDSKIENSKLFNGIELNGSELQRPGMSKWVNFTKAKNASKNEYANIDNQKASKPNGDVKHKVKHKAPETDRFSKSYGKAFSKKEYENQTKSKEDFSSYPFAEKTESISTNKNVTKGFKDDNMNCEQNKDKQKEKSKSLCDLSCNGNAFVTKSSDSDNYVDSKRRSIADIPVVVVEDSDSHPVEFQDFAEGCEIPLCAKLVSKQNKGSTSNHKTPSISSSSVRNESPFSESSHVYEDMFKETSCPSDSETSSWTVMKKNSYYVNGRSSSMNDLDLSDSCSLSIKCDYASSCSGQSTLQSRHSSCGSSSFYVNLRDYDSHMLEPSLIRKRKDRGKMLSNGNAVKMTNSNPPTPESLRHLFTSPLSSVHTPTNKSARLLSRIPADPQSHYYSTASAASSAFKHGFDLTPPKPKKTERSSSIKIKDIAHGIILTFRRLQNHSKNSHVSPTHYVDVSHLAEHGSKTNINSDFEKSKPKKSQKEFLKNQDLERQQWSQVSENGRTDSDSGRHLPDVNRAKARRSSSDSTGMKSKFDILKNDKKKSKNGKLKLRDKGKKNRSKTAEPRNIPTVSRKVQQMADGTLYLVTTVSGDTALPGVYSDTSSELSTHGPVKAAGESNC